MSVINTNISATIATNALIRNERSMSTAMERLSTGMRINSAKDDAAGLAISSRMGAMVSGLEMASKNANDAISMLEVAEGATLEISNMLIRMRELSVQSASGTYSDTDRDALDLEFGALMSEIDRIAKNTTWNTMSILNGGNDANNTVNDASTTKTELNIQLGPNASQTMALEFKAWVPSVAVDMQALNADGYNHVDGKSAFSSKADGLDARVAAAAIGTESSVVTFGDLAVNKTVTIGGLTFTASKDLTAAEVAAEWNKIASTGVPNSTALSDLNTAATKYDSNGDGTLNAPIGVFTGTTLLYKPTATSGATVTLASLTADTNVGDLEVSGKASQVITQGAAAVATEQKNESAFGDAVLYWNSGNGTVKAINIDTVGNSEFAIDQLDKAILGMATERAKYGAYMSRLEHSSDNLLNVAQNTDQSRSRIEDADYAVETSELARTQIISQAATAMLAQANQAKQGVLQLLQ
ncbi:flagellin [Gammaproteobacteria bacterium]|nr:flagellin [Gammaproteobacteria bacterium]